MRLDKFLWCVRLYKTRTLATSACKAGKVLLLGDSLKPSYECKRENEFVIKNGALRNSYRILDFPSSRVSAKLASQFIQEITSEEDRERNRNIQDARKENVFYEYGKPSKKDRREIKRFKNQ